MGLVFTPTYQYTFLLKGTPHPERKEGLNTEGTTSPVSRDTVISGREGP